MRNIDPATPRDEWCIAQTLPVRLFWLSLLLTVDDQGRFVANPALVRSQIFPADDISLAEVEGLLQAVDGKVLFYQVNGSRYGQIVNWWKYQGHAAWMGPSRFPPPEGWSDRYRYHTKGNRIVQSPNWREAAEPGPDERVEGEPGEAASEAARRATAEVAAELGSGQASQQGSPLGSAQDSRQDSQLRSDGGRSDGDVEGDGDNDSESEGDGDGDGDDGSDAARPKPRAEPTSLARSQFWDQDPGTPASSHPHSAGSAGEREAQVILLQASGLASQVPRVERAGSGPRLAARIAADIRAVPEREVRHEALKTPGDTVRIGYGSGSDTSLSVSVSGSVSVSLSVSEGEGVQGERDPPGRLSLPRGGQFWAACEGTIGALTPLVAIQEAMKNEVRNLKYVDAILACWKREGFKTPVRKPSGRSLPAPSRRPACAGGAALDCPPGQAGTGGLVEGEVDVFVPYSFLPRFSGTNPPLGEGLCPPANLTDGLSSASERAPQVPQGRWNWISP